MILEIAQIDVKPGMEAEFEAGVKKAGVLIPRLLPHKTQHTAHVNT
jgi:hypothetical protein